MGDHATNKPDDEGEVGEMVVPWRTLCGTAIVITALCLGYNGQLALVAVCALLGVELYGQKKAKNESANKID